MKRGVKALLLSLALAFLFGSAFFIAKGGITGLQIANQPPNLLASSAIAEANPTVVDLADYFLDADGDVLTYTTTDAAVVISGSTLTFTAPDGFSGDYTVTITVSDGTNTIAKPFTLIVPAVEGVAAANTITETAATTTVAASETTATNTIATTTPQLRGAISAPQQLTTNTNTETTPTTTSRSTSDMTISATCLGSITDCCDIVLPGTYALANNISAGGTCMNITASDVLLDCTGNTLFWDTTGSGVSSAIIASSQQNITIQNCIMLDTTAAGTGTRGINLTRVGNSTILNNIIQTNGTSNLAGMYVFGGAFGMRNTSIVNNSVFVLGTSDTQYGIYFDSSSNNTIQGNNVTVNGTQFADAIIGAILDNNLVVNNTLRATSTSGSGGRAVIIFSSGSQNRIIQNSLITNNAGGSASAQLSSVTLNNFTDNVILSNDRGMLIQVNADHNIITNNTITSVGGAALTIDNNAQNQTVTNNTLTNTVGNYALVLDNANLSQFVNNLLSSQLWISATNTIDNFTNTTFATVNGSLRFPTLVTLNGTHVLNRNNLNVSSNSAYLNSTNLSFLNTTAQITLTGITFTDPRPRVDFEDDGTFAVCNPPQCIEENYAGGTYVFNVSSFTTYTSEENVTACGDIITTDTSLTQNLTGTGACLTIGADNITLDCQNFTILYANTSDGVGINATRRNNITIQDCIVSQINSARSSSSAIYLEATNESTIYNVSAVATGSASNGVYITGHNNSIINATGMSTAAYGITIQLGNENLVTNSTASTGSQHALHIRGQRNNVTSSRATAPNSFGVALFLNGAHNSTLLDNFGTAPNGYGIAFDTSSDNIVLNTQLNITTGRGISYFQSNNNTVTNASIGANGSNNIWFISHDANSNNNTIQNFTLATDNGSIVIQNNVSMPNATTVSRDAVNITLARIFVNSTNHTFLNTTAQLVMRGLSFTDPRPRVDFEDDGTFAACNPPQCIEESYAGGTYVFNVSSFTTYTSEENVTACGDTLTSNTILTSNLSTNASCFNVTASNIFIDCNGYNLSGNNSVVDSSAFNVSGANNVTIKNCNIRNFYHGVFSSAGSNYTTVEDNNFTLSGYAAIRFASNTNYGTVQRNIMTGGQNGVRNDNHFGNPNHIVHNNTIVNAQTGIDTIAGSNVTYNYISGGSGDQLNLHIDNRAEHNILRDSTQGMIVNSGANNNIITNNTIINHSTYGMRLSGVSGNILRNNTFANNTQHITYQTALLASAYNNDLDTSNTADGLPIYFFYGNNSTIIEGLSTKHLAIANSQHTIIRNINITNGDQITVAASANLSLSNISQVNSTGGFEILSTTESNFTNFYAENLRGSSSWLALLYSSTKNNFTNLTLRNTSSSGMLMYLITSAHNNTFNHTRFETPGTSALYWIRAQQNTGDNTFWNTSFVNTSTNGSTLNFPYNFTVTETELREFNLSPSFNLTALVGASYLNTTARIILPGLTFTDPRPLFRAGISGPFTTCGSPQCTEESYIGGTFTFNVTHFSSYAASETVSACETIMSDTVLVNNISSAGTCISFGADNILLDCAGYSITYANSQNGYGVNISSADNATVQNCNFIKGSITTSGSPAANVFGAFGAVLNNITANITGGPNSNSVLLNVSSNSLVENSTFINNESINIRILGGSENHIIRNNTLWANRTDIISLEGLGNNTIINNTITVNTTGQAILVGSANNTISTNTVYLDGTSSLALGLVIHSNNNDVFNNTITTNGGHSILTDGTYGRISYNTVIVNPSGNGGITLDNADFNNATNNFVNASSGAAYAIGSNSENNQLFHNVGYTQVSTTYFVNGRNSVLNNNTANSLSTAYQISNVQNVTIGNSTANTPTGTAFQIEDTGSNTFTNNTANVTSGNAISLSGVTANNTFNNTILLSGGTWLFSGVSTTNNTFASTNFSQPGNGSVFYDNFSLPASQTVNFNTLDINQNDIFVNSTAHPFLNGSAQIQLESVSAQQAQSIIDFEDDGSFVPCFSPDCTFISYNGSTLVFNVSHFTSFSSTTGGVNATLEKTDDPDPLNLDSSTILNYTINFSVTDGAAFNITINETYPADVSFVNSTPNPTTGNFSWDAGNLSVNSSYTINITLNVSTALVNGTVINNTVNATYQNSTGDALFINVTEDTTILNDPCPLNITTDYVLSANLSCTGAAAIVSASNVALDCAGNTITFDTSGFGNLSGILVNARNNVTIRNCILIDPTTNDSLVIGINYTQTGNSTIENNTILISGTSQNEGVRVGAGGFNFTINNNTIFVNGTESSSLGLTIQGGGLGNHNITNNSVAVIASANAQAIGISSTSQMSSIIGNTIFTNGTSTTNAGLIINSGAGTQATGNIITTNGTSDATAILISIVDDVVIANNTLLARGNQSAVATNALSLGSGANRAIIENNTIFTNGTLTRAIFVSSSDSPIIRNNTLTARGTDNNGNYGVVTQISSHGQIINNTIRAFSAARAQGIAFQVSTTNYTAANNLVQTFGTSSLSNTIDVSGSSSNSLIENNTLEANGLLTSGGIYASGSTDMRYINNTISANNTLGAYAIEFSGGSRNNFTNNSVLSNGGAGSQHRSITLSGSTNNTIAHNTFRLNTTGAVFHADFSANGSFFVNNTILNSTSWFVYSNSQNEFNGTAFNTSFGIINLTNFTLSGTQTITRAHLDLRNNRAFINTTNNPQLNTSAVITLDNVTFTDPRPRVDFEDDGTFAVCNPPQCTELSYAGSTYVFNVSSFTTYISAENTTDCGDTIINDTTLTENLTGTATCLTLGADNIALDCAGYNISYANTATGYGVNATGRNNITIRNCNIVQTNALISQAHGISLDTTQNSTIRNTSVTVMSDSAMGISISTAINVTLTNLSSTANSSAGIQISAGSNNTLSNSIAVNNQSSNGLVLTSSPQRIILINNSLRGYADDTGAISANTHNSTITNNSMYGLLPGSGFAATFGGGDNIITNNYIEADNAGSTNAAIFIGYNTLFANNTLISRSTHGLSMSSGARNNTLENITVTAPSIGIIFQGADNIVRNMYVTAASPFILTSASANRITNSVANSSGSGTVLSFSSTSQNNTFDNMTLELGSSTSWITTDSTGSGNNISNLTFNRTDGKIHIINQTTIPVSTSVVRNQLNITQNLARLNSTNLSFLNTTAQITLENIVFTDPRPRVDFEDDGTFAVCNPPQCTEISYNGSTYVFNVSSFTSYTISENTTDCGTLLVSANLTENVTSTGTCFTIGADNITLDCRGNNINYSSTTAGNGVFASGRNNVTVRNCNIYQTNSAVGASSGILFSSTNDTAIINTSVNASGTTSAGIHIDLSSRHNITNVTANASPYPALFLTTSYNANVTNFTGISYASIGINPSAGGNHTFTNVTATGIASNNGFQIDGESADVTVNRFSAYSDGGTGISSQGGPNNRIENGTAFSNTGNAVQINGRNITLANVSARSLSAAISVSTASSITIRNVSANSSGAGITLQTVNDSIVRDSYSIGVPGLDLLGHRNNITNTSAYDTGGAAAFFLQAGENNTIQNSLGALLVGSGPGILLQNMHGTRILNTTGISPTQPGISVQSNSNYTQIINSTAEGGASSGIDFGGGHTALVLNSTARSNSSTAITVSMQNITITNSSATGAAGISALSAHGIIINDTRAQGTSSIGISLSSSTNTTVRNSSITAVGDGITLTSSSNGTVTNASVESTGGSRALNADTSNYLTITNSTLSGVINSAARIQSSSHATIANNTMTGANTLRIANNQNNTVVANTIIGIGNAGIQMVASDNNTIQNNYITSDIDNALQINGNNSAFTYNRLISGSGRGIHVSGNNNTLTFNNASANTGIAFRIVTGENNSIANLSLRANSTWLTTDATSTGNNLTNTTFDGVANGTIFFNSTLTIPVSTTVNLGHLNIRNNAAFLNSTNLTFLNSSARITLNSLSTGTAQSLVDFNDDGVFAPCVAPDCSFVNYNGSTFVFDVSHFTSFSSTDGGVNLTLTKTDSPDPIDLDTTTLLTYTITANISSGAAHNLTINETYPVNVTFVNSTPTPTTGNFSWLVGNVTNTTYNITIILNVSTATDNGSILVNVVNATYQNSTGSALFVNVSENTTVANVVCPFTVTTSTTLGANISCPATAVNIESDNVLFDCAGYNISYANTSFGYGINASARNNITIRNCNVQTNSNLTDTHALNLFQTDNSTIVHNTLTAINGSAISIANSERNNITNNTAVSTFSIGIDVSGTSSNNTIHNNTGIGTGLVGIYVSGSDNNITQNFARTSFSSSGTGAFTIASSRSLVTNNTGQGAPGIALLLASMSNSTFAQNSFVGSGIISAYLSGPTGNTFINNDFAGPNGAVQLDGNAADNTFTANRITTTANPALQIGLGSHGTNLTQNNITAATGTVIIIFSQNNTLANNTITDNGASIAVSIATTSGNQPVRNTLANNSILSVGGTAVSIQTANETLVHNNTIQADVIGVSITSSNHTNVTLNIINGNGLGNGIHVQTTSNNNRAAHNTLTATASGIVMQNGINAFNTFNNNTVSSISSAVIPGNAYNNTFTDNRFTTSGSQVLNAATSGGNNYTNNTFTGGTNRVILIQSNVGNDTYTNNTLNIGGTTQWFAVTGTVPNVTIFNTTFNQTSGSIRLTNATLQSTSSIALGHLNITTNRAFLNTTNLTFLNTTAQITLNGLALTTPNAIVDFNDDSLYTYCNSPQCTFVSFAGGVLVYDVASFTSYSSSGNVTFDKTDSPDPVTRGSTLNYTLTINNTGADTISNITVVETYPAGVSFVTSTPAPTSGNNTFFIASLAGGTSTTINITLTVGGNTANGTQLNNTANLTFGNGVGQNITLDDNETTTVVGTPQLFTSKTDTPDPVAKGTTLNYTIIVTNNGDELAYNTTLEEGYPSGTLFVTSTPAPTLGNSTFNLGTLAPGASTTINITVNVSASVANGSTLNNTYNVTFANVSGQNTTVTNSTLTTVLGSPIVLTIKSDTPDPVVRGQQLNYSILINNSGDDTAFNVTLSEAYPAGVSFVTAQPTPTGNNTFAIGTLLPNQSFLVNITVTVGSNVANGTVLTNSVNASFRNSSGAQGNVNDTETTTVLGIATATITKTDSDPTTNGSTVNYTITVTNTGDEIAYNVTVVEGYPSNTVFHNSTPAPTSGNDTFALGNLLPGASTTINITLNISATFNGTLNNTVNLTFTNTSGQNTTQNANASTTVNVVTPPAPGGNAGGGGGGGGGGGFTGVTQQVSFAQQTLTQNFKTQDRVSFRVNNEDHQITILDVTTTTVTIEVRSEPKTYTLVLGETRRIDANLDGALDIAVRVEAISYPRATLTLARIASQPTPTTTPALRPIPAAPTPRATETPLPTETTTPALQDLPTPPAPTPIAREPIDTRIFIAIGLTLLVIILLAVFLTRKPKNPQHPQNGQLKTQIVKLADKTSENHAEKEKTAKIQKQAQTKKKQTPAPKPAATPKPTPRKSWFTFRKTSANADTLKQTKQKDYTKDLERLNREMKEVERILRKK